MLGAKKLWGQLRQHDAKETHCFVKRQLLERCSRFFVPTLAGVLLMLRTVLLEALDGELPSYGKQVSMAELGLPPMRSLSTNKARSRQLASSTHIAPRHARPMFQGFLGKVQALHHLLYQERHIQVL